ncbi:hypothetical protein DFH09DRAFT_1373496 [Mycena vulgaris]|nr:hypothetical protein DFH09DRAFT_1373496 [Mycena vulgaris]
MATAHYRGASNVQCHRSPLSRILEGSRDATGRMGLQLKEDRTDSLETTAPSGSRKCACAAPRSDWNSSALVDPSGYSDADAHATDLDPASDVSASALDAGSLPRASPAVRATAPLRCPPPTDTPRAANPPPPLQPASPNRRPCQRPPACAPPPRLRFIHANFAPIPAAIPSQIVPMGRSASSPLSAAAAPPNRNSGGDEEERVPTPPCSHPPHSAASLPDSSWTTLMPTRPRHPRAIAPPACIAPPREARAGRAPRMSRIPAICSASGHQARGSDRESRDGGERTRSGTREARGGEAGNGGEGGGEEGGRRGGSGRKREWRACVSREGCAADAGMWGAGCGGGGTRLGWATTLMLVLAFTPHRARASSEHHLLCGAVDGAKMRRRGAEGKSKRRSAVEREERDIRACEIAAWHVGEGEEGGAGGSARVGCRPALDSRAASILEPEEMVCASGGERRKVSVSIVFRAE